MDTNKQGQGVPWSTWAAEDSVSLADSLALKAAQAEQTAANKRALFEKEGTPEEKVAAQKAEDAAKEMDRTASIAQQIRDEQQEWAVEQGELFTANQILAADPKMYYTDAETRLPEMGNIDQESLNELGATANNVAQGVKNFGTNILNQSKDLISNIQEQGSKLKQGAAQLKNQAQGAFSKGEAEAQNLENEAKTALSKEEAGAKALDEELVEDAQAFDAKQSAR